MPTLEAKKKGDIGNILLTSGRGGRATRVEGLEPPTLGFEGRCSIQLSYTRLVGRGIIALGTLWRYHARHDTHAR